MKLLKKITTRDIGLQGDDIMKLVFPKDNEKPVNKPLMRVWGVVTKVITELSTHGAYLRFVGMFEAVNLASGEMFKSGCLIVPGPVGTFLEGKIGAAGEGGEAPFAAEIGAIYDGSSATKYIFTGQLLGEEVAAAQDPLAKLRELAKPATQIAGTTAPAKPTRKIINILKP